MDKKEYFEISKELNLPRRCPILEKCCRRAWTIYAFSYLDFVKKDKSFIDILIAKNELPKDFNENKIEIRGEEPNVIKGNSNFFFSDICPEIGLFDKSHSNSINSGKACVSGSWDKYRDIEKGKIHECRHFSECPEYNYYLENKNVCKEKRENISRESKKKEIKLFLAKNQIEEAVELMSVMLIENENLDLSNSLIIIKSKHNTLKTNRIKGLETSTAIGIQNSRLVNDILEWLSEFD